MLALAEKSNTSLHVIDTMKGSKTALNDGGSAFQQGFELMS
jgi:hypothetical protein